MRSFVREFPVCSWDVYLSSILSSNAQSTVLSINPGEKQDPLGRAALQLGLEVESV